jgi:hypothetical protein
MFAVAAWTGVAGPITAGTATPINAATDTSVPRIRLIEPKGSRCTRPNAVDVPDVPGTSGTSSALLDVGPLVAKADGAMEQHRLVGVGREVAEPLELDDVTRCGVGECRFDLGAGEQFS